MDNEEQQHIRASLAKSDVLLKRSRELTLASVKLSNHVKQVLAQSDRLVERCSQLIDSERTSRGRALSE